MQFSKLSVDIKTSRVFVVSNYFISRRIVNFKDTSFDSTFDHKVMVLMSKLIYSDYIEKNRVNLGMKGNRFIKHKLKYKFEKEKEIFCNSVPTLSTALKYIMNENTKIPKTSLNVHNSLESSNLKLLTCLPYASADKHIKLTKSVLSSENLPNKKYQILYNKYLDFQYSLKRSDKKFLVRKKLETQFTKKYLSVPSSWMTDYDLYDDNIQYYSNNENYGTPNPDSIMSNVPCGGCGALLHCKDSAIPGYIPSEIFNQKSNVDLKTILCQRCHFIKYYNVFLDVRVSANLYPRLIEEIKKNSKAAVLLIIDLTDFPCSIWPQLTSLIGETGHVYVVGNKVDLLPSDSPKFLEHVKDSLIESMITTGLRKANIKHVGIISAKTGFGVEELINKLHILWQCKSNFIIYFFCF